MPKRPPLGWIGRLRGASRMRGACARRLFNRRGARLQDADRVRGDRVHCTHCTTAVPRSIACRGMANARGAMRAFVRCVAGARPRCSGRG
ncbi:hypothetical protein BMAGB8_2360 [Burkholderia mallei GB8 horse 4]|nr:hypothetical protein BMAGB8_2360 [Burkholderia mallei GB8 horse 4]